MYSGQNKSKINHLKAHISTLFKGTCSSIYMKATFKLDGRRVVSRKDSISNQEQDSPENLSDCKTSGSSYSDRE